MAGTNVGDLLNAKGLTWGWFQGGFAPTSFDAKGRAICGAHHAGLAGDDAVETVGDYIPHHEPFQYFVSTQNLHHVLPKDPALIGISGDGANHQYDLSGYGPRLPLLVISPFAKRNYIDHRTIDQSSILRFIEDNWDLGRIGGDSSDAKAGLLNGLFDFDAEHRAPRVILDPATGIVLSR